MKDNRWLAFAALALVLSACSGIGARKAGFFPESPPKDSAGSLASSPIGKPAAKPPAEDPGQENDGLDQPTFSRLPKEARTYFSRLSAAFRSGDKQFLASQGERDYSDRNRPRVEEDEYLALLYRIGPYAGDSPQDSDRIPLLVVSDIKSLRYQGWREQGPAIEMRGTFFMKSNGPKPFRVVLLWRLGEPKILGREP